MAEPVRIPVNDPIARPPKRNLRPGERDEFAGKITRPWIEYFDSQATAVSESARRAAVVTLVEQEASIGATAIAAGSLSAGLYVVRYYARITRAATSSSSLTVTFAWTESGVGLSEAFSAITGNTTTTERGTDSLLVLIDGATPLTYATTYASSGATAMQYRLSVVLTEAS